MNQKISRVLRVLLRVLRTLIGLHDTAHRNDTPSTSSTTTEERR